MKEYLVHLSPLSSIESTLASDTLFGALCWAIRTLYGEPKLKEVLQSFQVDPPFLLSSAFPYRIGNGQPRYFLPKPKYPPLRFDELAALAQETIGGPKTGPPYHSRKAKMVEVSRTYKRFRKVRWITYELFSLIADKGATAETILFAEFQKNRLPHETRERKEGVQKNSIDRLLGSTAGAGNTFYNQETYFPSGHGLYFLLQTNDITFMAPPLRFLEDAGIGANARTGRNRFRIRWDEFNATVGNKVLFVTLSRTIANGNMDADKSFYEMEPVRSKVESREEFAGEDVWKDSVTYLKEGSIVAPKDPRVRVGGIYPVKELHGKTIYQYGCAFPFWGDFSKEGSQ